jgi:hypothetical protein
MSEDPEPPGETPGTPAGTDCALCGTELSPSEYPNCQAVLIDETGPDETETIRMVCPDCFADLDGELADPTPSEQSA